MDPCKTFRAWNPGEYVHQAVAPADVLPEDDLVFFLLETVSQGGLGYLSSLYWASGLKMGGGGCSATGMAKPQEVTGRAGIGRQTLRPLAATRPCLRANTATRSIANQPLPHCDWLCKLSRCTSSTSDGFAKASASISPLVIASGVSGILACDPILPAVIMSDNAVRRQRHAVVRHRLDGRN